MCNYAIIVHISPNKYNKTNHRYYYIQEPLYYIYIEPKVCIFSLHIYMYYIK